MTDVPPRVDVYHHFTDDQQAAEITEILDIVRTLKTLETETMADLTELTAAVTENTTVDQSAIALLNQLADQIEALSTDPAALADLAGSLRSSSADLAAAVAANTPASPPPAP